MDNPTRSPCSGSPRSKDTIGGEESLSESSTQSCAVSSGSKEEAMVTTEECSVCRTEMSDTTKLSDCVHEFCYNCIVGWLTKGAGQFCPMCKTPVKYIMRKGTEEKITLEELKSDIEPAPTASADLVTEKRIVSRKIRSCRRLMNRLDEIIGASSSRTDPNRRQERNEELNSMKQRCVAQLNTLQMLRDDIDHGSVKSMIVSRLEFRRLIYERLVMAEGLPEFHMPISKREFLGNIEHYRAVLNNFLNIELKAIPAKNQPKVDKENTWFFNTLPDVAPDRHDEFVSRIFSLLSDKEIISLGNDHIVRALDGLITNRCAGVFLAEIQSLIYSKKTFLEWCGAVTYRINADRGGESGDNDVVTVNDDDLEDEPLPNETETGRPRRGPIYTPFDQIFTQSSSTENGNHRSSSDSDEDEGIYFQGPLRIGPTAVNQFRAAPHPLFPPIPPAGAFWSDLTRTTEAKKKSYKNNKRTSTKKMRIDIDGIQVVDLEDDNKKKKLSDCENDSDSEVQVVDRDSTIVLDDTIESRKEQDIKETTSRKRQAEDRFDYDWKKTKSIILPEGLVDDVQNLILKHKLPLTSCWDMMKEATKEAIVEIAKPKPKTLEERLEEFRTSASPSTSDSQNELFARYIARTGIGLPQYTPPTSCSGYH